MCTIVDTNMFLLNLKALLSLFTDTSSTIIGFMLCAKLEANSIVVLVNFWAWLSFTSSVEM